MSNATAKLQNFEEEIPGVGQYHAKWVENYVRNRIIQDSKVIVVDGFVRC
jgi:hypothetical protein